MLILYEGIKCLFNGYLVWVFLFLWLHVNYE